MAISKDDMIQLLQAQLTSHLTPLTTQITALNETQTKMAEAFGGMQQAVTNNTNQISETSKMVTSLAASHQQLEARQK